MSSDGGAYAHGLFRQPPATHSNASDSGPVPFICDWEGCGAAFRESQDFYAHVQFCHVATQFFNIVCCWRDCRRARMPFSTHDLLKSHLRVHTDERPFVCRVCTEGFRFASMRDRHEKQCHSTDFLAWLLELCATAGHSSDNSASSAPPQPVSDVPSVDAVATECVEEIKAHHRLSMTPHFLFEDGLQHVVDVAVEESLRKLEDSVNLIAGAVVPDSATDDQYQYASGTNTRAPSYE